MLDADLDDPLIDLELHDVVDIVNVLAVQARSGKKSEARVPKLFESEDP